MMGSVVLGKKKNKKTRIQERNEKRILDSAEKIFALYGYRGATIDKIAEDADMSKPNLHYYFKRKKDLYIAVLTRTLEIWLTPLSELDADGDPETELRKYIVEKVEMSREQPASSRLFANEILQGAPFVKPYLQTELRDIVNRKTRVLRSWIEAGKLKPVDPVHLIFLIWAGTQHYADFAPQIRAVMNVPRLTRADFEAAADSLCRIILYGVLPERSPVDI